MDANSRSHLDALLEQLEDEERALSALRRGLHDRIDMYGGDGLTGRERDLSDRRQALHRRIEALREERDLRLQRDEPAA
jgi:hypothetical protein